MLFQGVCCADQKHCCPQNTECDMQKKACISSSGADQLLTPLMRTAGGTDKVKFVPGDGDGDAQMNLWSVQAKFCHFCQGF